MRAVLLFILFLALTAPPALAGDWGPWEVETQTSQKSADDPSALDLAVRFYQRVISPVDGARCPMYPTCSAYARQALRKHGPLLGIFLTADRLMHEGDPINQKEPIVKWGFTRFYDPLEYNDFWLDKSE